MEPRLSFVTLGVSDLQRATRFYAEVLHLPRIQTPPEVTFFELGKTWLALYPQRAAGGGCRGSRRGFGVPRLHAGAQCPLGGGGGSASGGSRGQGWAHRKIGHACRLGRVYWVFRRSRWILVGSRVESGVSSYLGGVLSLRIGVVRWVTAKTA
jgi:catechol 2,3-dioxygenase-like lactoylglutathione lyase family enzyme